MPEVLAQSHDSVFKLLCRLSASSSDGNAAPWTTEEQKLLEQALKTYPVSTPERWDKIAAAVPGRNKKDCMKRYKVRRSFHKRTNRTSWNEPASHRCQLRDVLSLG